MTTSQEVMHVEVISKPPRLFKYQSYTKTSAENLERRQLWFSAPSAFNDPFDCGTLLKVREPTEADLRHLLANWPSTAGPPPGPPYVAPDGRPTDVLRGAFMNAAEGAMRRRVAENYLRKGVTCFSERPDDLLLWAHYGGGHRGFCLEFDTTVPLFEKVHRVRYVNEIPEYDPVGTFLETNDESFLDMLLTKAWPWRYEREWRILHRQPNVAWPYGDALVAVYLGPSMPMAQKGHIARILHGSTVELYDVGCDTAEFKLVIERLTTEIRQHLVESWHSV